MNFDDVKTSRILAREAAAAEAAALVDEIADTPAPKAKRAPRTKAAAKKAG